MRRFQLPTGGGEENVQFVAFPAVQIVAGEAESGFEVADNGFDSRAKTDEAAQSAPGRRSFGRTFEIGRGNDRNSFAGEARVADRVAITVVADHHGWADAGQFFDLLRDLGGG